MSETIKSRIGFIGAGNMGEALIGGIIDGGIAKNTEIGIFDVRKERISEISKKFGTLSFTSNQKVVEKSEKIFLAVKPQNIPQVLEDIKNCTMKGKFFITICAGISTKRIEKNFNEKVRVVRVMPNTPALIKCGASGVAGGRFATDDDLNWVMRVFNQMGIAVKVKEELLDAVTGLSGSGPAYVFRLIEAMISGGVEAGLPEDISETLAKYTVLGSAQLAIESNKKPSHLREAVTSPGGTTEAGLKVMNEKGFFQILIETIKRATERSKELGKY